MAPTDHRGDGRWILVVEDDPDMRDVLAELLEQGGYRVATASNGRRALDRLRDPAAPRPALVVLDLMMPVMNGYEFLEARAADPALEAIPVLVVTAGIERDVPGAAECLSKSLTAEQLLAAVARHRRSG